MEDQGFELGWGFYLIVLPLIVTLLLEAVVKPIINKMNDELFKFKLKAQNHGSALEKLKKWLNNF